jgi:hypothetical protein
MTALEGFPTMTRSQLLAFGSIAAVALCAFTAVALVGCREKPAPIVEAKPIDKPKVEDVELTAPRKPDASDAEAKKLLDEMLAAHTGGQPGKLDALRECSFTRKGQQDSPGGRFQTSWTRHLRWSDRYRVRMDMDLGGGTTRQLVFALGTNGAWRAAGGETTPTPISGDDKANLTGQMYEDALTLLFLFTDSATLVSKADATDPTVVELNVWVPVVGYARLGLDPKTKLLTRITYNGREVGQSLMKELTLGDYKEFNGVKLATKLSVRTKSKFLGEWTELSVDMTKPEAKLFDGP